MEQRKKEMEQRMEAIDFGKAFVLKHPEYKDSEKVAVLLMEFKQKHPNCTREELSSFLESL